MHRSSVFGKKATREEMNLLLTTFVILTLWGHCVMTQVSSRSRKNCYTFEVSSTDDEPLTKEMCAEEYALCYDEHCRNDKCKHLEMTACLKDDEDDDKV